MKNDVNLQDLIDKRLDEAAKNHDDGRAGLSDLEIKGAIRDAHYDAEELERENEEMQMIEDEKSFVLGLIDAFADEEYISENEFEVARKYYDLQPFETPDYAIIALIKIFIEEVNEPGYYGLDNKEREEVIRMLHGYIMELPDITPVSDDSQEEPNGQSVTNNCGGVDNNNNNDVLTNNFHQNETTVKNEKKDEDSDGVEAEDIDINDLPF